MGRRTRSLQGKKSSFAEVRQSYPSFVEVSELPQIGTIQTPQILELSGIGNKSILQANGVTCLHHLPGVGQNLRMYPIRQLSSKSEMMDNRGPLLGSLHQRNGQQD